MYEMWQGFEEGPHRFVFPDIMSSHYNVIDAFIDNNCNNYITDIFFYDSVERPSMRQQ